VGGEEMIEYRTRNIEYPITKEGKREGKMFNAQSSIFNVQVGDGSLYLGIEH
jgi:hypothetical protein